MSVSNEFQAQDMQLQPGSFVRAKNVAVAADAPLTEQRPHLTPANAQSTKSQIFSKKKTKEIPCVTQSENNFASETRKLPIFRSITNVFYQTVKKNSILF